MDAAAKLSSQPPSTRWIRGWRVGAVLIAVLATAEAALLGIDRWPLPSWRWVGLLAGLGVALAGTVLVWRAAAQPRWSGISALMLELGGPGRRAARRALRKGGPISPYMRSHAAIVAAAETGNPLAYTVPLVVAGQQILAAVNVDDSSALSSWFPFLSLLVAAAMLAVACGMALQVRHIRRNAVAAGLIPDIGGGAAGRECRQ